MEIAVIGAGSWGTALAKVLADKGHAVTMWGRASDHVGEIQAKRVNARYLPSVTLPPTLHGDDGSGGGGARQALRRQRRAVAHGARRDGARGQGDGADAVVSRRPRGSRTRRWRRWTRCSRTCCRGRSARSWRSSRGPSFAKEVGAGLPTAVVMASRDRRIADEAAALFQSDRFRVYTSDDVPGVELGGALKNVMAIAAGVADGLGLGHNSRAALITRGLAEISRLAVRKGANPLTLAGLAGLGDLVLTCTGDLSRNRTVGIGLGRGKTLREVLAGMSQVAEGVKTTKSAHDLARAARRRDADHRRDVSHPLRGSAGARGGERADGPRAQARARLTVAKLIRARQRSSPSPTGPRGPAASSARTLSRVIAEQAQLLPAHRDRRRRQSARGTGDGRARARVGDACRSVAARRAPTAPAK